MVVNGKLLLGAMPIKGMVNSKLSSGETTFGLGEAGYDIRIKQDDTFYRFLGLIPCIKIKDEGKTKWKFGTFTLASAMERFNVPFFFQAEDGIRYPLWSRGLGDVYKRQALYTGLPFRARFVCWYESVRLFSG